MVASRNRNSQQSLQHATRWVYYLMKDWTDALQLRQPLSLHLLDKTHSARLYCSLQATLEGSSPPLMPENICSNSGTGDGSAPKVTEVVVGVIFRFRGGVPIKAGGLWHIVLPVDCTKSAKSIMVTLQPAPTGCAATISSFSPFPFKAGM